MKLKVASTVKGRLSINSIYGVYTAGAEIEVSDEIIKSEEIQSMLRAGLLEGDEAIIQDFFVTYKNMTGRNLSFKWGQYVKPHQTFLLEKKHLASPEIKIFVEQGLISAVGTEKALQKETQTIDDTVSVKKSSDKKAEKSKIKRITAKKEEHAEKDDVTETKKANVMHAHTPEVLEKEQSNESTVAEEDKLQENDMEIEPGTVRFVDQEQKKEKFERLQKIINEKISANRKK